MQTRDKSKSASAMFNNNNTSSQWPNRCLNWTDSDSDSYCSALKRLQNIADRKQTQSMAAANSSNNSMELFCADGWPLNECDRFQANLFLYVFPALLVLCLIGNITNIVVYKGQFLRNSTTIQMLAAKAIANSLFAIFLIPNVFLLPSRRSQKIKTIYWNVWPFSLSFANVFGTCATWYTVVMTVERWVFIAFPIKSKQLCTIRNVYLALALCTGIAGCLQTSRLLTRTVHVYHCTNSSAVVYHSIIKPVTWAKLYDKVYHVVHSISVIILPILCMSVLTVLIFYEIRFKRRQFSHSHNSQKQCVTNLTVATTICHLFCETPALFAFLSAATHGADDTPTQLECVANVCFNFLSILNATIPCLIYLACVEKFRTLLLQTFGIGPSYDWSSARNSSMYTSISRRSSSRRMTLPANYSSTNDNELTALSLKRKSDSNNYFNTRAQP